MKDMRYVAGRNKAYWETVMENHLDGNTGEYGTLYRYHIFTGVSAGETVVDGWSQKHTAPSAPGFYTLYQYVQDGALQGFKWEIEERRYA